MVGRYFREHTRPPSRHGRNWTGFADGFVAIGALAPRSRTDVLSSPHLHSASRNLVEVWGLSRLPASSALADQYEDAARQARLGFLVEQQARKVIGEIYEISTRERLRSDSVRDFFTRWLARVGVELNHKTFRRYEGVTAEFLNWLGPRANLSIAHLSSVDIVGYRDYLARKHSPSSVNTSLAAIQSA